ADREGEVSSDNSPPGARGGLEVAIDELDREEEYERQDSEHEAGEEEVEDADAAAGGVELLLNELLDLGRIWGLRGGEEGGHRRNSSTGVHRDARTRRSMNYNSGTAAGPPFRRSGYTRFR